MLRMFSTHLFCYISLLLVMNQIFVEGAPVLIKTNGKSGKDKGGKLILIAGGKCGSPTLIKGGGKKGGEMILIGGQNGNCEQKPRVHVVKQFVPVPYYVPKPIFKYILRHHYIPVKHVVVKPVPVPYPVKTYSKSYKSGSSGGGGSGSEGHSSYGSSSYGSSAYDSGNMYDSDNSGSSKSNSLSSSDDGSAYSGSNIYGNYSPYGKTAMEASPSSTGSVSGDYMTGSSQYNLKGSSLYQYDGNSGAYGMPSGSTATKVTLLSTPPAPKSTLTSYSPYASTANNQLSLGLSNSQHNYPHPHHHQNNLKAPVTENYFYNSATSSGGKASPISDDFGTRINSASSPSTSSTGSSENGYQIAPVYQAPNGQLYSNGQLLSKEFLKSNTVVQAFPASASLKSVTTTGKSGVPASTNMNKNVLQQYSAEIEEAKKWFSGIPSKRREDSSENASANVSVNSSSSSSSEEDSSLEKEKGKGNK